MDEIPWQATYPLIISLYGLGTFVSGGILKFKPLLIGGGLLILVALGAYGTTKVYEFRKRKLVE